METEGLNLGARNEPGATLSKTIKPIPADVGGCGMFIPAVTETHCCYGIDNAFVTSGLEGSL